MSTQEIPAIFLERSPLLNVESYRTLISLLHDTDAPLWNQSLGDRIQHSDLHAAETFRNKMRSQSSGITVPSLDMCSQLIELKHRCWSIEDRLFGVNSTDTLQRHWSTIKTVSREDLATRYVQFVPHDIEFDRALVYDTSGTTGHPLELFHHPSALAQNHIFAEAVFQALGIEPGWSSKNMGCMNICAQEDTFVFCNTYSVWSGSAFAKINLNDKDWPTGREGARRFSKRWNPILVTSDPISLSQAIEWKLPIHPKLILSTAVQLSEEFRQTLEAHFSCPVINWYSATEVGPIACSLPQHDGMMVLAPDLFVEVVDTNGCSLEDGETGEICVTGGRNPYLPLLRYRTGDYGYLSVQQDYSGVWRRCIHSLMGRALVYFIGANANKINSVDLDRLIRGCGVFIQHQVVQDASGRLTVRLRPAEGCPNDLPLLEGRLQELFGQGIDINCKIEPSLGDTGKFKPYVCLIED